MSPGDIAEWAGDMWIMKSAELSLAENLCFMKELSVSNGFNMNFNSNTLVENDLTYLNKDTCDTTPITSLDYLVSQLNNPQQDTCLNGKNMNHNGDYTQNEDVLNRNSELEFGIIYNNQTSKDTPRGENYTNLQDNVIEDNSNSDKVLSVLGVELDLYFTNDNHFDGVSDEDIDKLLDKNISYKNFECKEFSETIEDFFNDTFDCDLFGDACMYESEPNQLTSPSSDNLQLMNMFPHISDENNRRRRSLLYERSCNYRQSQVEDIKNIEDIPRTFMYNYKSHPLLNHDYTSKKMEDEKCYPCPIESCDKLYAKSSHLKAHLRRHSGEKPFVCNWPACSWKFSRSDELARHKRSHSGIKPYKCEICDKAFARSDHLAKHKKVHRKRMAQFGSYTVRKRQRSNS